MFNFPNSRTTNVLPLFVLISIVFDCSFAIPRMVDSYSSDVSNLNNNKNNSLIRSKLNDPNSLFKLDLGQIFYSINGLTDNCRNIALYRERYCYARYLDGLDGLVKRQTVTNDVMSDFERKVCCAIWDWYDCTASVIRDDCTDSDWSYFAKFPYERESSENNLYREYCYGHEYNSGQCLMLPGWAYLALSIGSILVISCGCIGLVWYWRSGARQNMDYYRKRPGYHRPTYT